MDTTAWVGGQKIRQNIRLLEPFEQDPTAVVPSCRKLGIPFKYPGSQVESCGGKVPCSPLSLTTPRRQNPVSAFAIPFRAIDEELRPLAPSRQARQPRSDTRLSLVA